MGSPLDASPELVERMINAAAAAAAQYYRELPGRPVVTKASGAEVRAQLPRELPRLPVRFDHLIRLFSDVIAPNSRHNGHPRFFGYIASPGSAAAATGELLSAAMNANVTSWRSSPSATELEHIVTGWFKQIVGFPESALGVLVSGGSMANFAALAAARSRVLPQVAAEGIPADTRLRIYVSKEGHFSIDKAASLLGIGNAAVVRIPVDTQLRIRLDILARQIDADVSSGCTPMAIVGNAGSTATGTIDPLHTLADIAAHRRIWFHVDGAYGAFAALSPHLRDEFHGIARADSVALDAHKWLFSSMGAACVLYRDTAAAHAAFAHDADYTRPIGLAQDEAFAFWDYSPELSRPFRALPIFFHVSHAGADAIAAAIDTTVRCARHFAATAISVPNIEMLAPVTLSIFCFRYHPRGYAGDLDALNQSIMVELQRSGFAYLSSARVHGKFALRGCVLSYRTTERDMDILLREVMRIGADLAKRQ